MITTGVRWAESVGRRNKRGIYESMTRDLSKKIIINNDNDDKRSLFESCRIQAKRVCNPIVDWTDTDVWAFIHYARVKTNPLYQCGFDRVGCIGCPLAKKTARMTEFARWPTYKRAYVRAFDAMIQERKRRGKLDGTWGMGTTGIDVYHWWMVDGVIPGQMQLSGFFDE